MKICILTIGHPYNDERIFYREALSLKNNGFEDILLIAPNCAEQTVEGIRIRGFDKKSGTSVINKIKALINFYQRVRQVRADVYHCHELYAMLVAIWLKKRDKPKFVFDVHEYNPEQMSEGSKGIKRYILFKVLYYLEKYCAKKSDYVFTVCDDLVGKFKAWGCNAALVPNFARKEELRPFTPVAPFQDLRVNKFRIGVFAGGMYAERGLLELIQANRILKEKGINVALVFIGSSKQGFEEAMLEEASSNMLEDRIFVLGPKKREELINMLLQCDFGMVNDYPDKRNLNTIAVKIYEYMMCSLAVYAGNLPANKRLVESEGCGITSDPLLPEEIALSIEKLLSDPKELREMGKRGKDAYEKRYNWNVAEGQFIDYYRGLMKNE